MTDPYQLIEALVSHAVSSQLITEEDRTFCINSILDITKTVPAETGAAVPEAELHEILQSLVEDAVGRGIIDDDTESRDIFDTKLMAALTPFPHEVRRRFREEYAVSPQAATQWY